MFHYENGLFLTAVRLGIDVRRRLPRCFVSHAHADHIARHELAIATDATARFYRHRLGNRRRVQVMKFNEPIQFGPMQLTAFPAGHCLGSAMLLAEDERGSLLYTGDFKLSRSETAESCQLPEADILIMESTFGRPQYCLPPREQVIGELVNVVRDALASGKTPVIHAYALGKAQELTKVLSEHGIPILQHPQVYQISLIYQELGVDLGDVGEYAGRPLDGHALVTLPKQSPKFRLAGLGPTLTIAATGWAIDDATKHRWGVDIALPLSDHADFTELLETVRQVRPKEIFCTHGPVEFADYLKNEGYRAEPLSPRAQQSLF